jgi:serine protease AprX
VKRGLFALLLLALAAPLAASAGAGHGTPPPPPSYVAPSLARAASQTPNATVPVIVQSDAGPADARAALANVGSASQQLGIADAWSGTIQASDVNQLASQPGLVITPDTPVQLDAPGPAGGPKDNGPKDNGPGGPKDNGPGGPKGDPGNGPKGPPGGPKPKPASQLWPQAVGLDQLSATSKAPTIAFVDSGIESGRSDFGRRILASVDLTGLPDNSAGDGFGHGTLVAGVAAGSSKDYPGAAPTAGIVSLDVMDDNGMAKTSDVIKAAQWILAHHTQYNIRVANFSLHATTPTSFRWDPLDKAVEKLWFAGVVVVASAGNDSVGGQPMRMSFAPGNDPFAITVGALDLHNSTDPDLASVAPWSDWGYTFDGFAKPELSAPGRAITGPVPAGSTLANTKQFKGQVVRTPGGTYMTLSGTSLSAPIVSGVAADVLALDPSLTPDELKGALMLGARPLRMARSFAGGVGEVYAPGAAAADDPPNPNLALDQFLVPDGDGSMVFDDQAWRQAADQSPAWDSVSWRDGWFGAAWSVVSWANVSWANVSWANVSWSDVSWSDVSWNDVYGDVGP